MASSSSAHPSASEAEEPRSPQLHDQTGWVPIPTNDWDLRLDDPAWVREGSGSEAALAHPWRAAAAAAAVRLMSEEEEEEVVVVVEEEERRGTVPSLGDPSRAAVAAAAVRLMKEVEPSPPPFPPTARSNPPAAAAAPSRRPYLERREREARAELDKRLSDVTPPPEDDDARFRAAAEKIMERHPVLDFDLTCPCCGEDLEGRNMLLIVLELPADLRTDRLMTAAIKWLDQHPAPLL